MAGEGESYWRARGVNVTQRCGGDGCRGCAWCEHVGPKVVETDLIPPGPMLVGEFTQPGTEIVRELAGICRVPGCDHDPDNLNCVNPGRWGEQGKVGFAGAHHTSDGICVGHSSGELVGCAMENIGAGEEGRILLGGPEGVRRRHPEAFMEAGIDFGYDARALALMPHRWCCGGLPTDRHLDGCPTNFFAEGQTVIKPDVNLTDPWGRARLRIAEDRVSSDRTFENETRPL